MADCIGYHEESCYKCGVNFQMTVAVYNQRLKNGEAFFCPNGHGQIYSRRKKSEEKLKARVMQLEASLDWYKGHANRLQNDLDYERRSRASYQGHYNRIRREVARA